MVRGLIPGWYIVLDSEEVTNKPFGVQRLGRKLVFWRDSSGKIACLDDRCCHRGAQLSLGRVVEAQIECPFHGFQFAQDGHCTLIPANGRAAPIPKRFCIKSYPVRDAHGWIWLYWGDLKEGENLPPLPWFEDLDDSFSCTRSTFQDQWPVHFTRAIENQLDVTHLAFTHKKTIGRGLGTIVDGPATVWLHPTLLRFSPSSRKDDGQTIAARPSEVSIPSGQPYLEFRFPNLWQLIIHPKFRQMAAFVPVDDERTITYVRAYQGFVRLPLLRSWIGRILRFFNKRVLREDRAMVASQQPPYAFLKSDEMLIPGDRPIIEFRRRLDELLLEARNEGRILRDLPEVPASEEKGSEN